MLALSRHVGQWIHIGANIRIQVADLRQQGRVVIGIEAPKYLRVFRRELIEERLEELGELDRSAVPLETLQDCAGAAADRLALLGDHDLAAALKNALETFQASRGATT